MSRFRFARNAHALAAVVLVGSAGAALAGSGQPVVVELFTSQGCSSCPPANANLAAVSERPGVLALSFGVTYWDYLGWKDTFARPEFTSRQETYEAPLGHDGAFTPQIVVNGRADVVGNELPPLESLIARAQSFEGPALHLSATAVTIGAGAAPGRPADVWLVRYDPRLVEVPVHRGENGGRTLPHKNVVHQLARIGRWSGDALSLPFPAAGGLRTAVLVQAPGGGRILAAATD